MTIKHTVQDFIKVSAIRLDLSVFKCLDKAI